MLYACGRSDSGGIGKLRKPLHWLGERSIQLIDLTTRKLIREILATRQSDSGHQALC